VSELAQQQVDGVRISVDGRLVVSETTATAAGPSVLVLITALGELGVSITSTYIGHEGLDTLAAHLTVTRTGRELKRIEHSRDSLPVTPMCASGAFSTTRSKSKRSSSPARAARSPSTSLRPRSYARRPSSQTADGNVSPIRPMPRVDSPPHERLGFTRTEPPPGRSAECSERCDCRAPCGAFAPEDFEAMREFVILLPFG